MCQGLTVTRSLLKIGGHWVKVDKNIFFFVKVSNYGKPYVLFVFHQQEILCKSMGILRGGTTVGERCCPPTWK